MILLTTVALAVEITVVVRTRGTGDPVDAVVEVGASTFPTGPDGKVRIDVDPQASLSVTAAGHVGRTVELDGASGRVRVVLEEGRRPLEIVVEGRRTTAEVSRQVVDGEMAFETPGNREDAVRLVQSLPGVAVQREYSPSAGTLSVRGSAPHDSRYFLDGIEVPYLYHFNQYASVFPASQLQQLELYSSTFGPAWGDSIGAIVNAESKRDAPEAVHGSAFVNFVVVGGQVRAPLGKGWWASLGGRRSYQDLGGEQTDQFTIWPVFSDSSVQIERGDASRGTGVFLWTASDRYARAAGELDVLDPYEIATVPRLDFSRGFWVGGARHHWRSRTDWGRAVLAVVGDRLDGTLTGNGSQRTRENGVQGRIDAHHREADWGWDYGVSLRADELQLTVADPGRAALLTTAETAALARGVPVDDQLTRVQGGLYGVLHRQTGPIRWMPGIRTSFDSTTSEATFEPRVSAVWQLGSSTDLRAGAGRYAQRPPSEHLLPGTGDPAFPTTTSTQVVLGVDQTVAGRLELHLEGYRKWSRDLLQFPIDGPATVVPRGSAMGLELTWRYRVREVFFVHGWVGVARARLGDDVPAAGDQPLSVGLVASWDPTRRWNVAARYRLGSGLPYTPIEGSLYDAGEDAWLPTPAPLNSARMPLYQKVDLRAEYTLQFERWSLSANAELWFVPRQSAQLYPAYNYDYRQTTWVRGPTLFPLGGLRARW